MEDSLYAPENPIEATLIGIARQPRVPIEHDPAQIEFSSFNRFTTHDVRLTRLAWNRLRLLQNEPEAPYVDLDRIVPRIRNIENGKRSIAGITKTAWNALALMHNDQLSANDGTVCDVVLPWDGGAHPDLSSRDSNSVTKALHRIARKYETFDPSYFPAYLGYNQRLGSGNL